MMDMIFSVLTGGATGILGSVLGKVFNFVDVFLQLLFWQEQGNRIVIALAHLTSIQPL